MRIHYEIARVDKERAVINFLSPRLDHVIVGTFPKEDGKYVTDAIFSLTGIPTDDRVKLLRALGSRCATLKTAHNPYHLLAALRQEHGRQAVWDERQGKYRHVGTMKEGDNLYETEGMDETLRAISVAAKDETAAKKRIAANIQQRMVDEPDLAPKLAAWFANGMRLIQKESGAVPDALSVELLLEDGETRPETKPINLNKPKLAGKKK